MEVQAPMTTLANVPARIDTAGIAVPIHGFDHVGCEHRILAEGTDQESHRWSRKLPGGGFIGTGVGDMAWIEASLPKRQDGENHEALEVGDAVDELVSMYVEALSYLDVVEDFDPADAKLVRLDLVRDFHDVSDPTPLLDGLAQVTQPGRSKVRRFADPSANRAETLRVGPKAWGVTLYDKHVETRGKAPVGQLRCETRLHNDQLTSAFATKHGGQFGTVADLMRSSAIAQTPEVFFLDGRASGGRRKVTREGDQGAALARLQRAWFDRVGFGLAVPAEHELVRRLRGAGLSASQAASLWAFLTLPGWAQAASRNTRAKYRGLAEALGCAPRFLDADIPSLESIPSTTQLVRLDYDSGTLQVAA